MPQVKDKCPKGMRKSEYKACMDNLGLLEGEEVRFRFTCRNSRNRKGLLVFTNDNMIFMQQEGAWSKNYSQAIRIQNERITGVSSRGTFAKWLRIDVPGYGILGCQEFLPHGGQGNMNFIMSSIQSVLREARQGKKKLAQDALAKGSAPQMIFCKYCGTRNKFEQSQCTNCSASLT